MADFSTAQTRQGTDFELIPDGVLAKGWLTVEPFAPDQGHILTPPKGAAKNSYLKCKIQITEGEYERRVIFHNIMRGPEEKAMNMGNAQLRAILEYGANAGPSNPKGYQIDDNFTPFWSGDSAGIPVAIKVKAKRSTAEELAKGWKDRNEVALFLSPNPESDGHKDFLRLQKGETGPAKPAASTAAPATSWTKPAAPAAPAAAQPKAAAPAAAAPPGKPAWMAGGR